MEFTAPIFMRDVIITLRCRAVALLLFMAVRLTAERDHVALLQAARAILHLVQFEAPGAFFDDDAIFGRCAALSIKDERQNRPAHDQPADDNDEIRHIAIMPADC
jgi:hypothetical protein